MLKLFISQPMKDLSDEEIKAVRKKIIEKIRDKFNDDVEVIDSYFEGAPHNAKPLWFLGKSFQLLSTADVVCFGRNWDKYRGCKMEHEAAKQYCIDIVYADDFKE